MLGQPIDILLIEDNPGDVELLKASFEMAKISNRLAVIGDGEQALNFFADNTEVPGLILLDINLPKRSGFEVLKRIRSLPATADIPVVILTSSESDADIARSYSEQASYFFSKPMDFDKFMQVIKSINDFQLAVVKVQAGSCRHQ